MSAMQHADVETLFDPATNTATHIVSDPATGMAAIIDPVLDYEPKGAVVSHGSARQLLDRLDQRGLTLQWLLETHVHADHLSAGDWLRRQTGVPLVIGAGVTRVISVFAPMFGADDVSLAGAAFDRLVHDGDTLPLGDLTITVMDTHGHTPACVTYLVADAAFVGDTLFMPDYGTARCDFPGGDAAVLHASIQRLLGLPPQTRLFTGHDYLPAGRTTYAFESSVAAQRAGNVHVHDGISAADFIAMRTDRDKTLAPPTLILPALQVNIRAGALPPPDPQGRLFLKLPLTVL
ncbi:MBL fold metallo-hydrolase [Sandarakinorhabdus sp.]|uniref:MBL fold metallo-hydrolase n=1 Tax=Sandarakinorhabdus sp. TaxID=1916663 RepID=UPI00286DE336|nr:MBL fold metallo-hydrolase [Sandarakinorhabdus sp.]